MHIPAPIADQVRRPGAILMNGIGAMAFAFGVWQFGWTGVAVACALLAMLLIIQLWAESARLTRVVDGLREEERANHSRIAALENKESRLVELEAEIAAREQEIQELRSDAQRPAFGEQRLLETVEAQVKLVDLTQKHRLMSQDHPAAWPVVRASLTGDDGTVVITAVVGDEAERLAEEYVTLTDDTGYVQAHGQVRTAGDREIRAAFSLDALPYDFTEGFEAAPSFSPAGYLLQLSGLTLFPGVTDEKLEALGSAALALSKELMGALVQQANATDQSQLSGGEAE